MRINKSFFSVILILCSSFFFFSSCQKLSFTFKEGEEIHIRIGSGSTDSGTKASYAGTVNDGSERIDWQIGDLIRIYCENVSEPADKFADYQVSTVQTTDNTKESWANIECVSGVGLRWGTGLHTFYGAYPSPEAKGVTKEIEANKISALVPANQTFVGDIQKNDDNYTVIPDLNNMLMTAKNAIDPENGIQEGDNVFLSFTPLTTTVQFTIVNDSDHSIEITKLQLISGNGKNTQEPVINGAFTVDMDKVGISKDYTPSPTHKTDKPLKYNQNYPLCESGSKTSANQAIDRTLSIVVGTEDKPLILKDDKSLTFTFFLNPVQDFEDLTFKYIRSDGTSLSTRLAYADGAGVFFPRHKKTILKGIMLPDEVMWHVNYEPSITSWSPVDEEFKLENPDAGMDVILTKWDEGIEDDVDLAYHDYEYKFYLADETDAELFFNNATSDETKAVKVISEKVRDDGKEYKIDWFINRIIVGGSTIECNNSVSFDNIGGFSAVLDDEVINISSNNAWSPISWAGQGTIDLSKFDFQKETFNNPMSTANCYVIRHAGTYKIPLVYGNGVVGGAENEQSYYPAPDAKEEVSRLFRFKNHLGNGITSAFIENNTTDGEIKSEGNKYIKANSAEIIWQDKAEVVKNVKIVGDELTLEGDTKYDKDNVRYLQFTVDQSTICQNNALIAIKDADGKIMWSWHIWTTNDPALLSDPITVYNNFNYSYDFFPINCLGCINYNFIPNDDVHIFLTQKTTNKKIEIVVKQSIDRKTEAVWYQFGRKDPICSTDSPKLGSISKVTNGASQLETAIQNPSSFNKSWSSGYLNLWTGALCMSGSYTHESDENDMTKTIYDPSPVGYVVPPESYSTAFTTPGHGVSTSDYREFNVDKTIGFNAGYYFYTCRSASVTSDTPTIYFPAVGYRDGVGTITNTGGSGRYWASSCTDSSNGVCFIFNGGDDRSVTPVCTDGKSYGLSVRPVKEK